MSDPVTNVEIEDVLSSIRKLVADEVRATPVARKPERPGRLILTAAQRVKDEAPEPDHPSAPVLLTQPILPESSPVSERSIDDIPRDARLADFGEVEGAFPDIDAFTAPHEEAELPADEAATAELHTDDAYASEEIVQPAEDEAWHPDESAHHEDTTVADRDELSRLIDEEVSAALGLIDDDEDVEDRPQAAEQPADADWDIHTDEVEQTEHDDTGEPGAEETSAWTDEDDRPTEEHDDQRLDEPTLDDILTDDAMRQGDDQEQAAETASAAADVVPVPPQTLEDKVAALGRLVARGSQDFEEERDRPDADELAAISEPMTWPEAPYEEAEDAPVADGSNVLHAQDAWPQPNAYHAPVAENAPVATGDIELRQNDDMPAFEIDEETLRQMVVDIVRQELQGALGERITRNVRKLVRREIHRMLISQDFE